MGAASEEGEKSSCLQTTWLKAKPVLKIILWITLALVGAALICLITLLIVYRSKCRNAIDMEATSSFCRAVAPKYTAFVSWLTEDQTDVVLPSLKHTSSLDVDYLIAFFGISLALSVASLIIVVIILATRSLNAYSTISYLVGYYIATVIIFMCNSIVSLAFARLIADSLLIVASNWQSLYQFYLARKKNLRKEYYVFRKGATQAALNTTSSGNILDGKHVARTPLAEDNPRHSTRSIGSKEIAKEGLKNKIKKTRIIAIVLFVAFTAVFLAIQVYAGWRNLVHSQRYTMLLYTFSTSLPSFVSLLIALYEAVFGKLFLKCKGGSNTATASNASEAEKKLDEDLLQQHEKYRVLALQKDLTARTCLITTVMTPFLLIIYLLGSVKVIPDYYSAPGLMIGQLLQAVFNLVMALSLYFSFAKGAIYNQPASASASRPKIL